MKLICVEPSYVGVVYPHVEGYLKSALSRCGDWSIEDVAAGLSDNSLLLWVVDDGQTLFGGVVTEILETRRGRICHIVACGGKEFSKWRHLISVVEQHARDEGCRRVRFSGRKGWKRMFPDYREPFVTIEKAI